jgi:hypothetical protein
MKLEIIALLISTIMGRTRRKTRLTSDEIVNKFKEFKKRKEA